MRAAPALLLLLATPALAQMPEVLDCKGAQFCAIPGACGPASPSTPVLAVTVTSEGAAMESGGVTLEFRRVGGMDGAQVFLLERADGVGLFTLEADLRFAIASHERVASGLSGTIGTGQCSRRGG